MLVESSLTITIVTVLLNTCSPIASPCHFFVTVDIKGCYDSIDSNKMLNILSKLISKVSHSLSHATIVIMYLITIELLSVPEYDLLIHTHYTV